MPQKCVKTQHSIFAVLLHQRRLSFVNKILKNLSLRAVTNYMHLRIRMYILAFVDQRTFDLISIISNSLQLLIS